MLSAKRPFMVAGTIVWNYLALHGCLNLFRRTAALRTLGLYAVLLAIAASAWGVHMYSRHSRRRS